MASIDRHDRLAQSLSSCLAAVLRWTALALSNVRSEWQVCVLLDRFHHEEGARLPNAGQGDQLLAVELVEVLDVPDADLQQVVEVPRDQIAAEHLLHSKHGALEGRKSELGRGIFFHSRIAIRMKCSVTHAPHDAYQYRPQVESTFRPNSSVFRSN